MLYHIYILKLYIYILKAKYLWSHFIRNIALSKTKVTLS